MLPFLKESVNMIQKHLHYCKIQKSTWSHTHIGIENYIRFVKDCLGLKISKPSTFNIVIAHIIKKTGTL